MLDLGTINAEPVLDYFSLGKYSKVLKEIIFKYISVFFLLRTKKMILLFFSIASKAISVPDFWNSMCSAFVEKKWTIASKMHWKGLKLAVMDFLKILFKM